MEYIQKIGIGSDGQMILPKFTSGEQVGLTTESGSLLFNTDTNKIEYYDGTDTNKIEYYDGTSWKEL